MLLQTDIIKLRALELDDLNYLYEWENDTSLWIHGNTLSPYPKLTLRQYIIETQQHDIYEAKQLRLMICCSKNESEVLGAIDLYDFDPKNKRIGVGILITKEHQGKGYATQALNLIKKYTTDFLDIHQLYAHILSDNKKSICLFQKAGFSQSGTLLQWIYTEGIFKDVAIYQLLQSK